MSITGKGSEMVSVNYLAAQKSRKTETENFQRTYMQKEIVVQRLKEHGCRMTRQRRILLDVILQEECTCCKEIYYRASSMDEGIGAATVYRMVNLLEEIGAIDRKNMYRISCCEDCKSCTGIAGSEKERASDCKFCETEINYHEIIECITCALDAKDPYTAGHSQRVSDMALKVCELMGMKVEDREKIHIAAHLHDIGKIGVPDAILNKAGKLTDEEFESIKKHPVIGAEILGKSKKLSELSDIVLMHHERFDGNGYPTGKAGTEIPIGARIIAICDSIDAITSNRCYREAHDFAYCYEEIRKNLGKMYDPIVGRYVLDHWEEICLFHYSTESDE